MRLRRSLCLRRSSRREVEFCMIKKFNGVSIRESRIPFACNSGWVDFLRQMEVCLFRLEHAYT